MTDEDMNKNFLACIEWINERKDMIGSSPLYIGFGDDDFNHYWNKKEFECKEYSLSIGADELPVKIKAYGSFYMQTFGFTEERIRETIEGYKNTGMCYPNFYHTFDQFYHDGKEKFLLAWKLIKARVQERIDSISSLDKFEL